MQYEDYGDLGPKVDAMKFIGVSNHLFGSRVYGESAQGVIDDQVSRWTSVVMNYPSGEVFDPTNYTLEAPMFGKLAFRHAENNSSYNLIHKVQSFAAQYNDSPFDFTIEDRNVYEGSRRLHFEIIPNFVRLKRLANFVMASGLDTHNLRGTLGKTANVLAVAAGLTEEPDPISEIAPEEFLKMNNVFDYLKGEVSKDSVSGIQLKINQALSYQIGHGEAMSHLGEIVIEGPFAPNKNWTKKRLQEQSITRDSLVMLAESYKNTTRLKVVKRILVSAASEL